MLIAQITDLHALPPGQCLDGLDTNALFGRALRCLTRLEPAPDLVLITGDLAEGGTEQSYEKLEEALAMLDAPYFLAVGNHDRREAVRRVFSGLPYMPKSGPIQYTVEDYPVRLVSVDTLDEGRGGGCLCSERIAWLDGELARRPETPTLLFMHHPPFTSGIDWMDASRFRGVEPLAGLLRRHRQVRRIVCGHLHRPILSDFAGIPVSVAPSTCYQVHLDLAPAAPPHIVLEPPACHLHLWDECRFVTHEHLIASNALPICLRKQEEAP